MAKFCGKCGTRLDENTGLCPNCDSAQLDALNARSNTQEQYQRQINDAPMPDNFISQPVKLTAQEKKAKKKADKKAEKARKKADKKGKKAAKKASRTTGQKIRIFLLKLLAIFLALIILVSAVTGVLVYFNVVDIPFVNGILSSMGLKEGGNSNDINTEEPYESTAPDAESYFRDNSQVISTINVNDSDTVTTESETFDNLIERGFGETPITTEYSMDGEYYSAVNISQSSSTMHPIYQTLYLTENGDIWTIFVINGAVMANPVSYNLQSTLGVQVIISESDTLMSYDSTTNKFYETIPNESELIVKKVSRIDAKTLESLTIGGIDKL